MPRCARYTHCREDQLFFRTSYWQAFERMQCDINGNVGDALDLGGLIYTPGVGIMRGPLHEGALWYQDPPRVDVIWVALPPRPQLAAQEQYAHEHDRNTVARIVDHIFLRAAGAGVDILVMPPLGCGAHGCQHPPADVADIIFQTAQRYSQQIPDICIGSDLPQHCEPESGGVHQWWQAFTHAVQNGRPPIDTSYKEFKKDREEKIQKLRAAGILYGGKDFDAMLEKNRKLSGLKPRTPRRKTFL
jgi:hypothetical protein